MGVTLFFVLSGFLITTILIENHTLNGRSLARFYYRRALRLFPAFMTVIVLSAAALIVLGRQEEGFRTSAIAGSYVANWAMASGDGLGPLNHAWSLSVEEQFYLVWPLVFLAAWPWLRKLGPWPFLVGATIVVTARIFMWESAVLPARLAFGTDTQAHGLLLGAGIAVLRRQRTIRLPWWTASISITVLCVVAWIIPLGAWYFELGQPVAVAASGVLILATVTTTGPIARRLLSGRPMRNLGRISYSAYLWHYPIMWHLGVIDGHVGWLLAIGSLAISLAAAMVSYYHIERPILRWRDRPPVMAQAASAPEVAT